MDRLSRSRNQLYNLNGRGRGDGSRRGGYRGGRNSRSYADTAAAAQAGTYTPATWPQQRQIAQNRSRFEQEDQQRISFRPEQFPVLENEERKAREYLDQVLQTPGPDKKAAIEDIIRNPPPGMVQAANRRPEDIPSGSRKPAKPMGVQARPYEPSQFALNGIQLMVPYGASIPADKTMAQGLLYTECYRTSERWRKMATTLKAEHAIGIAFKELFDSYITGRAERVESAREFLVKLTLERDVTPEIFKELFEGGFVTGFRVTRLTLSMISTTRILSDFPDYPEGTWIQVCTIPPFWDIPEWTTLEEMLEEPPAFYPSVTLLMPTMPEDSDTRFSHSLYPESDIGPFFEEFRPNTMARAYGLYWYRACWKHHVNTPKTQIHPRVIIIGEFPIKNEIIKGLEEGFGPFARQAALKTLMSPEDLRRMELADPTNKEVDKELAELEGFMNAASPGSSGKEKIPGSSDP